MALLAGALVARRKAGGFDVTAVTSETDESAALSLPLVYTRMTLKLKTGGSSAAKAALAAAKAPAITKVTNYSGGRSWVRARPSGNLTETTFPEAFQAAAERAAYARLESALESGGRTGLNAALRGSALDVNAVTCERDLTTDSGIELLQLLSEAIEMAGEVLSEPPDSKGSSWVPEAEQDLVGVDTGEDAVAGWQELLVSGLKLKASVLQSPDFKSASDASVLLGVGEPAIRKRIRERKLFALKTPVEGDYRIPLWALDAKVAGATTLALHEVAKDLDSWRLYHFMVTPSGSLHGLRPFECMLSSEHLTPAQAAARAELAKHHQRHVDVPMLDLVLDALRADIEDGPRRA